MCRPLTYIFNKYLKIGIFPKRWRISYISPIFKSGSRRFVDNYRGVAILPTIAKLFELLVSKILTSHFTHFISPSQHGFMKGRSTVTNLLEFSNYAISVIEGGDQLDVVYTDIRKAFDRLRHSILLQKLYDIGIHSSLLNWIRTYLHSRYQYVRILGCESQSFIVKSGVPQGSHLGPLLFILFMNDVVDGFPFSKCLLFADDLKIFRSVRNVRDASVLQRDLDTLSSWCQQNGLDLNIEKCKCMSFYRTRSPVEFDYMIDGNSINRVNMIRDLGILFDEKMSFASHIDYIVSKAYSMLGFMMRICSEFNDPLVFRSVYYSHVRSNLEYGSVVWYPVQVVQKSKIESVQKKFLIYLFKKFGYLYYVKFAPYDFKIKLMGLESLEIRRTNACHYFIFDLLSGRINSSHILSLINISVPPISFRHYRFLIPQFHRTNYGVFEPLNNMIILFNTIFEHFDFNVTRQSFRNTLRSLNV